MLRRGSLYEHEAGLSKWLTYAEKDIEVMQALRLKSQRLTGSRRKCGSLKIVCWIQIVTEVEAERTDRCLITQPYPDGVRGVIVTAVVELRLAQDVCYSSGLQALRGIRLVPAHKALEHIVTGGKHIAHIVKDGEAEAFSEVGQTHGRKSEFLAIYEQCRTTYRKARVRVARTCLI
jgi:hypothetical protein